MLKHDHELVMQGRSAEWLNGYVYALAQTQIDQSATQIAHQRQITEIYRTVAEVHDDPRFATAADQSAGLTKKMERRLDKYVEDVSAGLLDFGGTTREEE